MRERRRLRGGRLQSYHVTPVRYTVAAGGDDAAQWNARLTGFLLLVAGILLVSAPLIPLLGTDGNVVLALLHPFWGGLGLVTAIPRYPEPWMFLGIGAAFVATGIGILRESRVAYLAGMAIAVGFFMPAVWAGTLTGGFLAVALWRGERWLARPAEKADEEPSPSTSSAG